MKVHLLCAFDFMIVFTLNAEDIKAVRHNSFEYDLCAVHTLFPLLCLYYFVLYKFKLYCDKQIRKKEKEECFFWSPVSYASLVSSQEEHRSPPLDHEKDIQKTQVWSPVNVQFHFA